MFTELLHHVQDSHELELPLIGHVYLPTFTPVLLARLKDQLSSYKLPRHVVFVSPGDIPMTDSGKLDRRKLRDTLAQRLTTARRP